MQTKVALDYAFKLADVEMTSLPTIPLKILTQLDLSGNRLADLPFLSAEGVPNLRHLNLSRNQVIRLTNFNNVFGCLQLCKSMKISTQGRWLSSDGAFLNEVWFMLRPCPSSVILIRECHPWMGFFHPWMRFFHPWMEL